VEKARLLALVLLAHHGVLASGKARRRWLTSASWFFYAAFVAMAPDPALALDLAVAVPSSDGLTAACDGRSDAAPALTDRLPLENAALRPQVNMHSKRPFC
jgi:predicted RNA polymerase sigma factor